MDASNLPLSMIHKSILTLFIFIITLIQVKVGIEWDYRKEHDKGLHETYNVFIH